MMVLVHHRPSNRAFSYDCKYQIFEPLILEAGAPTKYHTVRCWWRPMCPVPAWAAGLRDHEFDTYWMKR